MRLVPLAEVLAEVHGVGASSRRVQEEAHRLQQGLGPELEVLRRVGLDEVPVLPCGSRDLIGD